MRPKCGPGSVSAPPPGFPAKETAKKPPAQAAFEGLLPDSNQRRLPAENARSSSRASTRTAAGSRPPSRRASQAAPAGAQISKPSTLSRLKVRRPVAVGEAERAADVVGRQRLADRGDLTLQPFDEPRLVAPRDEHPLAAGTQDAAVPTHLHPPSEQLGIDHRDASRPDGQVVDVRSASRYPAVMQEVDAVILAQLALERSREPDLAIGPVFHDISC